MRRSIAVASLLAAVAVIATSRGNAWACGDFYAEEAPKPKPKPRVKPTPEQATLLADAAMQRGEPSAAASALSDGFADLKTVGLDAPWQKRHAVHMMAVALARTDGSLPVEGPFFAVTAGAKAANLRWASATLRALSAERPNDPVLLAELGEVLAHIPSQADEALRILGGLADKDVMGSAYAYAELARLRALHGDAQGAAVAASRCGLMAVTPAVCAAAHASTPSAASATRLAGQTGA